MELHELINHIITESTTDMQIIIEVETEGDDKTRQFAIDRVALDDNDRIVIYTADELTEEEETGGE